MAPFLGFRFNDLKVQLDLLRRFLAKITSANELHSPPFLTTYLHQLLIELTNKLANIGCLSILCRSLESKHVNVVAGFAISAINDFGLPTSLYYFFTPSIEETRKWLEMTSMAHRDFYRLKSVERLFIYIQLHVVLSPINNFSNSFYPRGRFFIADKCLTVIGDLVIIVTGNSL